MRLYVVSIRSAEYLGPIEYFLFTIWADNAGEASTKAQKLSVSKYYKTPAQPDDFLLARHFHIMYAYSLGEK